jgi:excisionase family DNA binding protein
MTNSAVTAQPTPRRLVGAREVAGLLGCSWRTVLRLADAGRIPWGVKLGSLRRWDLREIEDFIAAGCKLVRGTARSQPGPA